MHMGHIILSSVAFQVLQYFSTLSHKGHDFRRKTTHLNIKSVFIFSTTLSETFLILRRIERGIIKIYIGLYIMYPLVLSYFNKT